MIKVDKVPPGLKAAIFLYDIQQPTKKLHNLAIINILTALNLKENLVITRNAKHVVQSASFNAQEKREPGLSRIRSTSPTWQEKSSANLREVKNRNEKVSAVIEKSATKNVKKSQKKALAHMERPITIQILEPPKRRRQKRNNGKNTKIEESLLKTKYSNKGSALFISVYNLIKATNAKKN